MQGQPSGHEEQNSPVTSPSTKAIMDDSTPSTAVSAVPQVRSRITVVCAECKRLKLKCDRRTPCGSCTKRDTVARCVYSPAAAEKVDLHSINNRLIQVEALLAMITAGKTPPPFQSSYPLRQVLLTSTSHSGATRPSHIAVSNTTSPISIRMHDLVNVWMAHCQLDLVSPGSSKYEIPLDGPYVKQEPTPLELLQPSGFYDDNGPSTISTKIKSTTTQDLPPLHLYHTTAQPHEETSHPSQTSYFSELNGAQGDSTSIQQFNFHTAVCRPPSATPGVFSHLPPPPIRTRLLVSARSANPHLSLLIHWTRVIELADPAIAAAREEKERQKNLANTIFGARGAPSALPALTSTAATNLPLFACMCYLLALGALEQPSSVAADHSFLYALAGQAMGVWEEYTDATETAEASETEEDGDVSVEANKTTQEKEKQDLDHVVALLLQVKYLLRVGPSTASKDPLTAVFPLIGKLVNTARGLGLARDPEEDVGVRRSPKADERRRVIWWDIMYHDIFTSDVLEHAPILSTYSYTTKIPAVARSRPQPSSSSCCRVTDDYDCDSAGGAADKSVDREDEDSLLQRRPILARLDAAPKGILSCMIPPPNAKAKAKTLSPDQDDSDTGFFGVRCRLVRLAQSLKHRLANPGCDCCSCGSGYTLDQAAKLESEIRSWTADLPSSLRLETSSSTIPPSLQSPKHTAIAAELAVLANRMIIAVYVPLMRPSQDSATTSNTNVYSAAHAWTPVSRATTDAAQGVVRASLVLHRLAQGGSWMPFMGGYYPLQKAVIDALVICAHAGFVATKPGRAPALMEEVGIALELLDTMRTLDGQTAQLLASLRRRIESGDCAGKTEENLLKRKHDALEISSQEIAHSSFPMEGVKGGEQRQNNRPTPPPPLQQQQQHQPMIQRPPPQRHQSISRAKGSDKKHSKKGPSMYPAVGFRDRGKDNAPWAAKKVNGSQNKERQNISEPRPGDYPSLSSPAQDSHPKFEPAPQSAVHVQQTVDLENGHRSRSSSISQMSHPQVVEYSASYAQEQDKDTHQSLRRRFSVHDIGVHQQQQQPPEMLQESYAVPPSTQYMPSQQPSSSSSFEVPHSHEQSSRSFDQSSNSSDGVYGSPSSPYPISSAPLSTASSPYCPPPAHQQAPMGYSSITHDPTAPNFVSQPPTSSPPDYYQMSNKYGASYEAHMVQQPQNLGVGTVDTAMPIQSQMSVGEAMVTQQSVPSTPAYETTQQVVYDTKSPLELAQQEMQMRRYQVANEHASPLIHTTLNTSAPQTWPPMPHYMTPSQATVEPQDRQYWTTGQAYYQ
ncbi:hypothetical protein H0H87_006923 [Tephrocybe sp. NHM501043]|nr:hypothetical protein H0H87_006923 [Tephrocybe sp. NHM501043]